MTTKTPKFFGLTSNAYSWWTGQFIVTGLLAGLGALIGAVVDAKYGKHDTEPKREYNGALIGAWSGLNAGILMTTLLLIYGYWFPRSNTAKRLGMDQHHTGRGKHSEVGLGRSWKARIVLSIFLIITAASGAAYAAFLKNQYIQRSSKETTNEEMKQYTLYGTGAAILAAFAITLLPAIYDQIRDTKESFDIDTKYEGFFERKGRDRISSRPRDQSRNQFRDQSGLFKTSNFRPKSTTSSDTGRLKRVGFV